MNINTKTIAETLTTLIGDGNVCELRALGVDNRKRTDSGYFDDFAAAAAAIEVYATDPTTKGCYVVLNEIDRSLLSRASNRMERFSQLTTSDKDVTRRRWLYIDCDPKRPSGISATDAECELAIERTEKIREWLMAEGTSEPIHAMSGNGAHLLVPIDLPNDDESLLLVKNVLAVLSEKFSDESVDVDQSVCNAARICRLYGTPARKGDSTAERPHRVSVLTYVPDCLKTSHEATAASVLKKIAGMLKPEPTPQRHVPQSQGGIVQRNLLFPQFLQARGIQYNAAKGPKGDIFQIDCPFDANHKKPDAYVGQIPNGALVFHCSHNSCQGRAWREFTEIAGRPAHDEWDIPYSAPRPVVNPVPQQPRPEPTTEVTTLRTAAMSYAIGINEPQEQLLRLNLGDLDFALGGGVAHGEMVIMAARPSHGKSMIALQAIHSLTADGVPCCFMSEEMSATALGKRTALFATPTTEDAWRKNPAMFRVELESHFRNRAECYVIENSRTTDAICNRVRKLQQDHGIQVAVIDYAQLLQSKGNGRYEQVTNTSIALRQLTTELGITTIVLCQLNRSIEGRNSFQPQMGDLKDSGQLEQDADVLVTLMWQHKLDSTKPEDEYSLFVQKNRNREIKRSICVCRIEPSRQRIVSADNRNNHGLPEGF
jgi:KaiC/GvpD/RAD55 family RecA-like ATPase